MKQGLKAHGFTIIEVMVVLAVSSAILIGGLLLVNGQQARQEFLQAVNDMRQQLDDLINNVSTGYYSKSADFTCTPHAAGQVDIDPLASPNPETNRGTQAGCIYIGRAMQFAVAANPEDYNTYNIVGRQNVGGTDKPVTQLSEALPKTSELLAEVKELSFGLKIHRMKYETTSGSVVNTSIFTIASDLGQNDSSSGNLSSSSRTAKLYGIKNTDITDTTLDGLKASNILSDHTNYETTTREVSLCFDSNTDKYAVITIGSAGGQLSTDLQLVNKTVVKAGDICF